MSLTNIAIVNALPRDKPYKLADSHGLYVLVTPQGSKLWGMKYRYAGREKSLRFGPYPAVSLKDARKRHQTAREQLEHGVDPSQARRARVAVQAATFLIVGTEYIDRMPNSERTKSKQRWLLDELKPLHHESVSTIGAPALFKALEDIERDGRHETAHRAKTLAGQILRYANVTGRRTERDISEDVRGLLKPVETESHAALTDPEAVAGLLRAIDVYDGAFIVRKALQIAPLVMLRPFELRYGHWSEINFDKAEWLIPAARMKMKRDHLVPLPRQAVDHLAELQLEAEDELIFPSPKVGRDGTRPISENTLNAALAALGYAGRHTSHGFRATGSTLINEQLGYAEATGSSALVELQLAHAKKNTVAGIYDRSQRVPERRVMMQKYADYLDELRAGIS